MFIRVLALKSGKTMDFECIVLSGVKWYRHVLLDESCMQWSALWYNLEWNSLQFSARHLVNILSLVSVFFICNHFI